MEDDKVNEASQRFVKGTFNIQMRLTQDRVLTVTGHLYDDDSPESTNKRIDEANDAIDRQFIRCDLMNMEAQRTQLAQDLKLGLDRYEELKAKQDGVGTGLSAKEPGKKRKLFSVEEQQLQHLPANLDNARKNIGILNEKIAAARAKLGLSAA